MMKQGMRAEKSHMEQFQFDGLRIKLEDESDINRWCKLFKCTVYELRKAVMHVGTSARAVEAYLEMNNMKTNEE